MEENAKIQDGGHRIPSLLILKLNKLHNLLYFSVAGKHIVQCKEYILPLRSIIYVLYSFTDFHCFSTFYIGLLFTHTTDITIHVARFVCLFDVMLHHNNTISDISWK